MNGLRHMWRKLAAVITVMTGLFVASPVFAQVNTNIEGIALSDRSPVEVVIQLINWFLGVLALFVVVYLLYGGFLYMTSQGDPAKIQKATDTIKRTLIGLLIVLSAWGITLYILSILSGATGTSTSTGGDSSCTGCSVPGGGSSFYVLSTNPEANETDVYLCSDITVRMSEYVDQSTVTSDNWYLSVQGGASESASCSVNSECASALCQDSQCVGSTIAGEIGFGPGDSSKYFNFIPDADLPRDTTYQAVVSGGASGVTSVGGQAMTTSYTWLFTTGSDTDDVPPTVQMSSSSPYPEDDATNVCTNTPINFDFSESMRISTFDDEISYVVDYAGTSESPETPDWSDTESLRGWTFGGDFDYAMVRPSSQLEDYSLYSVRLFGGDADNNFSGSVTDSCGNPLDGDEDGVAEGADVDSYYGFDSDAGESEDPITWETGERADCTPVIESISPTSDYYGEYDGKHDGEACSAASECASGICTSGYCVGYGDTSLTITGLDLAPHPEVRFEGSVVWASEDFNSCFDEDYLGSVTTNTAVGDICFSEDTVEQTAINLRTPVGSKDTPIQVVVADETSEESSDELDVLSPNIQWISPEDGAVGQYITIHGQNFGNEQGSGYVVMRSADGAREVTLSLPEACGDVWSSDEIIAVAPQSYTESGVEADWETGDIAYIQVVTNGGRQSDLQLFEFSDVERPNLCAITPSCHENAPNTITVTGENFGSEEGSDDLLVFTEDGSSSYYGSITGWDDAEIVATTDESMGQASYYANVYDGDTGQSSNVRTYEIPCNDGPQVVQIASCNEDEGIYPVPNPRPNSDDACLNATVGVLFDQEMNTSSFSSDTVYLRQYNSGETFNADYSALSVRTSFETRSWEVDSGEDTYYGFQLDIERSQEDDDQDGVADGDTSAYLQPNTWYELTVTTGVSSREGVSMSETYTSRFKTDNTEELCEVSSLQVSPSSARMNTYMNEDETDRNSQDYTGTPYAENCSLLDGSSYTWDWSLDVEDIGDFGIGTYSVSGDSSQTIYVVGDESDNEGRAIVDAAIEGISDDAEFVVDLAACSTDSDCASCSGSTCNTDVGYCTPVVESFNGTDGSQGTYVTINGCMFGGAEGSVYWSDGSNSYEAPEPEQCGVTWANSQIVVEVPTYTGDTNEDGSVAAGDDEVPNGDYTIIVENRYEDSDSIEDQYTVNDEDRPGLCEIDPDTGGVGNEGTATGERLTSVSDGTASFVTDVDGDGDLNPDREEADGSITWATADTPYSVTGIEVSESAVTSENGLVLNLDTSDINCDPGTASCTNAVDYVVTCENNRDCGSGCCGESGICLESSACFACETDSDCSDEDSGQCLGSQCIDGSCTPVIEEFSPSSGPHEGPVTISGCYFGAYSAASSSVSFGGIEANLLCDNTWSNSAIIAQVPSESELSVGSVEVSITRYDGQESSDNDTDNYLITALCTDEGADIPDNGVPVLCSTFPESGYAESVEHSTAEEADKDSYRDGSLITFYGDLHSFDYRGSICSDGVFVNESCDSDADCEMCDSDDTDCIATYGEGATATCEDISGDLVDSEQRHGFTTGSDTYVYGHLDNDDTDFDGDGEADAVYNTEISQNRVPYGAGSGYTRVETQDDSGLYCPSNGVEFTVSCSTGDDCPDGYLCLEEECVAGSCTTEVESCSEISCGSTEGCYYADDGSGYCCGEYPEFEYAVIAESNVNVCPNALLTLVFSEAVSGYDEAITVEKVTEEIDESGDTIYAYDDHTSRFTIDTNDDGNLVFLNPDTNMDTEAIYLLTIESGEEVIDGIVSSDTGLYLSNDSSDLEILFETADNTCYPDDIEILHDDTDADSYTFTEAGETAQFTGHVYSDDGQEITETDELTWDFNWTEPFLDDDETTSCVDIAWIDTEATDDITEATQTVVSGDYNNEATDLSASLSWEDSKYGESGTVDESKATLATYFCNEEQEVWSYIDRVREDTYTDEHLYPQNFAMYYCVDENNDIPNLELQYVNDSISAGEHFLEYFFQNPDNTDQAFAIRVYSNNDHYFNPSTWYDEYVPNPGAPTGTEIDGYEALEDGMTYYVGATVALDYVNGDGSLEYNPAVLYNNMYVFAFNDAEGMESIASQIIESVKFNWNVSMAQCEASDKEKLVRDTKRLNDLHTIAELADIYYSTDETDEYPIPESDSFGSYIVEMTVSRWNSWQGALGNVLGVTLPTDPYNVFYAANDDDPWTIEENGITDPWIYQEPDDEYDSSIEDNDCDNDDSTYYFDQSTGNCWDTVNQEFYCPEQSHVYMYRVDSDNQQNAYLFGHMEYDGSEALLESESYNDDFDNFDACSDVNTDLTAECSCFNFAITSDESYGAAVGQTVDDSGQSDWVEVNF